MTTLVTYNNKGIISKKWILNENIFKHFGVFLNLEDQINISHLNHIPLIGITDDNFKYIYDMLNLSTSDVIIYLQNCDTMRLYNIYSITDFLIMEKYQRLSGIELANRLNEMNMKELKNIINKIF